MSRVLNPRSDFAAICARRSPGAQRKSKFYCSYSSAPNQFPKMMPWDFIQIAAADRIQKIMRVQLSRSFMRVAKS